MTGQIAGSRMKIFESAHIYEISAGHLVGLQCTDDTWCFTFERDLAIESYAGWKIIEHDFGGKLLLGSADLESSPDPLGRMNEMLGEATCEAISFNQMSDAVRLEFFTTDTRLSLELFKASTTRANFKIIYHGVEETDI